MANKLVLILFISGFLGHVGKYTTNTITFPITAQNIYLIAMITIYISHLPNFPPTTVAYPWCEVRLAFSKLN